MSDPVAGAPTQPANHPTPRPAAPTQGRKWACERGKIVFQEGEESYDLLILDEGKVDVFVGEEKRATLEGPGVILGEIGALLRQPRSAKVRAVTPCQFTVFESIDLLMAGDPHRLLAIARSLATKLAQSNEIYNKQVTDAFAVLRQHKVKQEIMDAVDEALGGKKKKTGSGAKRTLFGVFHF